MNEDDLTERLIDVFREHAHSRRRLSCLFRHETSARRDPFVWLWRFMIAFTSLCCVTFPANGNGKDLSTNIITDWFEVIQTLWHKIWQDEMSKKIKNIIFIIFVGIVRFMASKMLVNFFLNSIINRHKEESCFWRKFFIFRNSIVSFFRLYCILWVKN